MVVPVIFHDDKKLDRTPIPVAGWYDAGLLTRTLQVPTCRKRLLTIRNGYLRRMRPDWITIVMGSNDDPQGHARRSGRGLLGYAYLSRRVLVPK